MVCTLIFRPEGQFSNTENGFMEAWVSGPFWQQSDTRKGGGGGCPSLEPCCKHVSAATFLGTYWAGASPTSETPAVLKTMLDCSRPRPVVRSFLTCTACDWRVGLPSGKHAIHSWLVPHIMHIGIEQGKKKKTAGQDWGTGAWAPTRAPLFIAPLFQARGRGGPYSPPYKSEKLAKSCTSVATSAEQAELFRVVREGHPIPESTCWTSPIVIQPVEKRPFWSNGKKHVFLWKLAPAQGKDRAKGYPNLSPILSFSLPVILHLWQHAFLVFGEEFPGRKNKSS